MKKEKRYWLDEDVFETKPPGDGVYFTLASGIDSIISYIEIHLIETLSFKANAGGDML